MHGTVETKTTNFLVKKTFGIIKQSSVREGQITLTSTHITSKVKSEM